ncbi:MAG: protein kinase [Planctomycetes bacterium]|nr:protein kinase [Planctomycetota bacterium]
MRRAEPTVAHVPFVVPPQIAGYRIVRLIGAGGMGLVYEAAQEALGRSVALKVMQPGGVSGESLARFESEARALGKLDHPGIARVFDAGVFRPGPDHSTIVPYLSMELIEGGVTYADHCERSDVTLEAKLGLLIGACRALQHAHDAGIVHRDLKPSNMLVTGSGGRDAAVKLIDFGIAKVLGDGSGTITSRGQLIGTPSFMAPEQITDGVVDARTDIFAMGVVIYQLCTGRMPHSISGDSGRRDIQRAICETPAPAPRSVNRRIEPDLETIILKCLEKQPADRYGSAGELADDLEAFLSGESIRARRDGVWRRWGRRLGRFASRKPLVAFAACTAVCAALGMGVIDRAMLTWPELSRMYWDAVSFAVPAGGVLPDIRAIVIDDATDFESVARSLKIEGVANDNVRSVRLLHAALLRRLSGVSPRAVGVDVLFRKPSEFDRPLVEAISELRKSGTGVVLASPGWEFDREGLPPILKDFSAVAWSGPATGGSFAPYIWMMEFAVERLDAEVMPSFSLLCYAAGREPDAEVGAVIVGDRVELRYFKKGTDRRVALRPPDRVRMSGVETINKADDERGLRVGDHAAGLLVPLPRAGLSEITVPMQRALSMADADFRKEFAGRTVLIGNASKAGGDLQEISSGVVAPGVWTNASAVQQILRNEMYAVPEVGVQWAAAAAWAALGAFGAYRIARPGRAGAWLGALTLGALFGSVLLLRTAGYIWNPVPAIVAGCLGAGLAIIAAVHAQRMVSARTRRI